ncbi:MAG: N-6 DNA methylase [Eisenbergiella sp.]
MDNQVHNAIVSFIWGIADDCLRDIYVRGKYRDVILPMTVIRRLDAMLEDTKPAVLNMKKMLDDAGITNQWPALCNAAGQAFCNASPFCLRDLTSRAKKQTLKADFEAYLDGFSPNVQEILEKFKFRNQIDTMIDADILGAVIEKFVSPDINLSPYPVYRDDSKTQIKFPALDNHGMGTVFEELVRRFNEANNEEAGEHWTPRDVVELMADLVVLPVADRLMDATYSCYDGACGTGGMLTVAQDRLLALAKRRGKDVSIHLFGQEVQPETYAICKADMLLKGDGDQAEHITYGSTLSADGHATRQFDFMLANPPYGKSWKTDAEKMGGKKDILDSRFNAYLEDGTPLSMIPRVSDGQLLFLLNNVAKMKKDTPLGSRIAEVHNGSSIFTGDAGSGESNARRYLIENDLVEAIIALPENMFYNTGIGTYIWVLSNKKEDRRVGKIQLIDATAMKSPLRKNMGKKNCELTPEIRNEIMRIFLNMEESDVSKIFDNEDFAYWNVTVERPLRLRVFPEREIPASVFKNAHECEDVKAAIIKAAKIAPIDDWIAFSKATKLKSALLKKIRPFITEKDATAQPIIGEADVDLRDTEDIPLKYVGGVDEFVKNEVHPYAPDAYVDHKKTQIGYEISFTEVFYKPKQLDEAKAIIEELTRIERETDGLMQEITADVYSVHETLPAQWETDRLAMLFAENKELNSNNVFQNALQFKFGTIIQKPQTKIDDDLLRVWSKYTIVHPGDIMLNGLNLNYDFVTDRVGIVMEDGIITSAYISLHPRENVNSRYYTYFFKAVDAQKIFHGMGTGIRLTLSYKELKSFELPTPSSSEQSHIVDYLDWQMSKINTLINAKKEQIALLEQLKMRTVLDVVTGQVNTMGIAIPEFVFVEEIKDATTTDADDKYSDDEEV